MARQTQLLSLGRCKAPADYRGGGSHIPNTPKRQTGPSAQIPCPREAHKPLEMLLLLQNSKDFSDSPGAFLVPQMAALPPQWCFDPTSSLRGDCAVLGLLGGTM